MIISFIEDHKVTYFIEDHKGYLIEWIGRKLGIA